MSEVTLRQNLPRLGFLQIAIILLAIVTGLVHLDRGITTSALMMGHATSPAPRGGGGGIMSLLPVPLPVLFLLNFAAYIILAVALYLPALIRVRNVLRWLLIALAVATITLWYLITRANLNILSIIDKPVEVALIVLLLVDWWQARSYKAR